MVLWTILGLTEMETLQNVNHPPATQGITIDAEERTEMREKGDTIDTTAGTERTREAWSTATIRMEDTGTTTQPVLLRRA